MSKSTMPDHWISAISYQRDTLECACGEKMKAKPDYEGVTPWVSHRKSLGLSTKSLGNNPIRKGRLGDPER